MATTIKTMGGLRNKLAEIMELASAGKLEEKDGRMALNAATRIVDSFQAESRARLISLQLGEKVSNMGAQVIGEIE
jgi:hypothetical protein